VNGKLRSRSRDRASSHVLAPRAPFFTRALASTVPPVCQDADLQIAVIAGLGLDASDALFASSRTIARRRAGTISRRRILKALGKEDDRTGSGFARVAEQPWPSTTRRELPRALLRRQLLD